MKLKQLPTELIFRGVFLYSFPQNTTMQLFKKDLPDFRLLFRKRLLPDFSPPSEEKKKGAVQRNLRKFIISRKPMVSLIAKRTYERVFINTDKLDALGDSSMRTGHFQLAKEIYEGRRNWTGMAIAQMGMKDIDGATKTLNEKYLFSKRAALLFTMRIKELDKAGNCTPRISNQQTRLLAMPSQNPIHQTPTKSVEKKSQKDKKASMFKKPDTDATRAERPKIEAEELF
jgi:hypothetical protein